jgi:hypothetical protein
MKKVIFLPALVLVGFTALISCKKNNDDAVNPSKQACTLDHSTTTGDSTQSTYDSDNRVIKQQQFNNSGSSQSYTLYTYSSGKIVEKNYDATSAMTSQVDYHLNGNNNVGYSVYTTDGSDYSSSDTTWYTYDSDKHNTRRVTKNTTSNVFPIPATITNDTTWYTYTGGNLTKKEVKTNGAATVTTVYSYGSDDAKSEFLAPESSNVTNLYGDTSAKLPTSMTQGSTTTSYVYETNSEGYATRKKEIISGVTQSDEHFYYNCK